MKILVTDGIEDEAVKSLEKSFEVALKELSPGDLLKEIENYNALIVRSKTKVTKELIAKGKNLKVIGRAGVGVDNIDVPAATARGIVVVNAPLASTVSVAELAIGHMLCLARKIPQADVSVKAGRWEKKTFKGIELCGKVLGFIGSGRIGGDVVKRAKVFGMKCISYDPYLPKDVADKLGLELVELDRVLVESDFLTIHAVLTDETKGMIGEKELGKMKKTAFIVNCARGGIINESALYQALKDGKIAGAALDVFENEPPINSPLLTLPNVVFTPHLGASTEEAQQRAGITIAEQVTKAFKGEKPEFIVNKEVWDKFKLG